MSEQQKQPVVVWRKLAVGCIFVECWKWTTYIPFALLPPSCSHIFFHACHFFACFCCVGLVYAILLLLLSALLFLLPRRICAVYLYEIIRALVLVFTIAPRVLTRHAGRRQLMRLLALLMQRVLLIMLLLLMMMPIMCNDEFELCVRLFT